MRLDDCPRCGGPLAFMIRHVSRTDLKTEICGACRSTETALVARGARLPWPSEWPVQVRVAAR